ncbi:hypothetical protein P4C99_17415 [Pontiellaceae bacterium B1224]|nr:hypothetical protein [Pontiellaceae bacterium B1224]
MKQVMVAVGMAGLMSANGSASANESWTIGTQEEWTANSAKQTHLEIKEGKASPTGAEASVSSIMKRFPEKRSMASFTISQSPDWLNWKPVPNVGPAGLGDAPVALQLGDGDYWMFGRFKAAKTKEVREFAGNAVTLDGFDIPLKTTPFPNVYNAPGGLKKSAGGYHVWQSKDMVNWVHHGSVTKGASAWVTTAEVADGKFYIYYDFPNDQDPHLFIDEDLTDGVPGKDMGMAFNDPTHGSDCVFIRDLDGNFHVIAEDWSPINAQTHAWDSPLAIHAVSPDGINDFKILEQPPVDERTTPTGKFAEYYHPHWHAADPEKYPGVPVPFDIPKNRIKKGDIRAVGRYEIHEPEQNAYGDWAAICIGGQYYLFGDFDRAGSNNDHGAMSVAWFTSDDINAPFTFCGSIGKGHPDPEILFAEGQFYLLTQTKSDYISPGPWVDGVEVRVGVDTSNDGKVDQWSDWKTVSEQYDYIEGFSKQIAKIPAQMDLSGLPEGYGFQFEIRLSDATDNEAKPIIDAVSVTFN